MATEGDYKSKEFPQDFIRKAYKRIITDEGDSPQPEAVTETTVLVTYFWKQVLKLLHTEFASGKHSGKRLVEIGCGPGIFGVISASKVFDEIILSDIGEYTLQEVRKWLDGAPDAVDWSPVLTYAVNLEGNLLSADEAAQRVREAVKCTTVYDIHDDPPPLMAEVDCIISLLVLDTASTDLIDFQNNIKRIASMMKGPRSTAILSFVLHTINSYNVAGKKYPSLNLNAEIVISCLSKAGFTCINIVKENLPGDPTVTLGRQTLFISAQFSIDKM